AFALLWSMPFPFQVGKRLASTFRFGKCQFSRLESYVAVGGGGLNAPIASFRYPGLEPGSRFFFYCGGEAGPRIKSGVTGWGSLRPAAPYPGLFACEDALQFGEEALAFGAFVAGFGFAEQFEQIWDTVKAPEGGRA
ncbi:hypothetical protein ACFQ0D_20915, partial [Micromonospora zhanjiangensis]